MHFCLGENRQQLFHGLEGFEKDATNRNWKSNFKTGWTAGIV